MTLAYPTLQQMRDELHVGEEFLAKYNRPGPRYTSYPTAPVWNDSFGPADLENVFEEAESAKTPVSLYMHIPFCESLCLFCACNVVIQKNKSVAPPYLEVLKREMECVSRSVSKNRPVVQFHWGGGTPTYLTPEQIADLFAFTKEHFHFDPDSEIGIEVDPRVTSREHLETLRKLGFNRLSMGIQDFHADVQEAVHRIQPYEMTRDLLFAARDLGFDSINVDLIYGLPYQTADTFAHTVDQILGLAPDRIALFSYAIRSESKNLIHGVGKSVCRLVGKAVNQIDVDAIKAEIPRGEEQVAGHFVGLNAVHRLLHIGMEVLNAHAETVEAELAQSFEMLAGGHTGVDLDANFTVGVEMEMLFRKCEQVLDLFGRQVRRCAPAPMELDYGAILRDAAADAFHLPLQHVKIGWCDAFVLLDNDVACAKEAEAFTEGNVHVQRNGCPSTLGLFMHPFEIGRTESIVPDRRGGIAGIARPRAIVLGEKFIADVELTAHLLQAWMCE